MRKFFASLIVLSCCVLWSETCASLFAQEKVATFPFLISYDGADNASSMKHLLKGPAGADGFIRAENGRFVNDKGPVRLNGTNLTGSANFPTHDQADKLARRLARFGINCVRLHYFDSFYGNFLNEAKQGIITKNDTTLRKLDAQQRDRQDYLIATLIKAGIYIDMNLHVARHLDMRDGVAEPSPPFNRGVDSFTARIFELQKEYAKELLTHVNPYTGRAYTDEPGIAVVEMNNENSLFVTRKESSWEVMAPEYKLGFRRIWNEWLKKRYKSTESLLEAWGQFKQSESEEQITDGTFEQPIKFDQKSWTFLTGNSKSTASVRNGVLVVDTQGEAGEYFPKLFRNVRIEKDKIYTISFRVRKIKGSPQSAIGLAVAETKGTWKDLGTLTYPQVGKNWQKVEVSFQAFEDSQKGQLQITRMKDGVYEIDDLSLRQGAVNGYKPGGTLEKGTVDYLRPGKFASKQARLDFARFLYDTEEQYWTGMHHYLKDELKIKQVVSGTQLHYSPPQVQAKLDYVDIHSYWQHPSIGRKKGDSWSQGNNTMVHSMAMIQGIASQRVADKPYTISEYNHPFPAFYGAEGQPMLRAYGRLHGWDGVFEYTYNHFPDFEPQFNIYFFSMIARTDVLAHFPACSAMFLRGDVIEAKKTITAPIDEKKYFENAARSFNAGYSLSLAGFNPQLCLVHKTTMDVTGKKGTDPNSVEIIDPKLIVSDTGEITWNRQDDKAPYWMVNTANTKVFTGFPAGRTISLGDVELAVGKTSLNWATVSLTSRNATGFGQKGKANILLAATAYCGNKDMIVKQLPGNRITLKDWGTGPVQTEGVPATITLPCQPTRVHCYALDPEGNRKQEVPVIAVKDSNNSKRAQIQISPEYKTVWYEIDVQ